MQQYTGSTKATAWVEEIVSLLSLSPQVERARELEGFTRKLDHLFKPGEPLDVTTKRRMETFFGYDLGEVHIHRGQEAEEASRRLGARAFTFRGHIFGTRQNLDTQTSEGRGLLAHELTHVIQQTQPRQIPQGQPVSGNTGSVPQAPSESQSSKEMVLLAPAQSPHRNSNPQQREAQARANEQLAAQELADTTASSPIQINPEEVADKVYRLMQYDLVLERERATKLGG